MVSRDAPVIAVRELRTAEQRVVTVSLRLPSPHPEGDWECGYSITGLEPGCVDSAKGVDSIQALIMALEGIRVFLESSGAEFSWEGGEGEAGFLLWHSESNSRLL